LGRVRKTKTAEGESKAKLKGTKYRVLKRRERSWMGSESGNWEGTDLGLIEEGTVNL